MKMHSQYLLTAALATAFFSGCGSRPSNPNTGSAGSAASPAALHIVAIERVYGDLAQQLGGDAVAVTTILNSPSADPHGYEATPRDADAISSADVVIENGLGYDAFADKLLAASPRAGRAVINVGKVGAHATGDNPHVWYEVATLRLLTDALASELVRRLPAEAARIERKRDTLRAWIAAYRAHTKALGERHAGARVAITEPVFDYVLHAAGLQIATPPSFSHAIEEGDDPAPQDVATMHALLTNRRVSAFVYNQQTVEPSTTRLLDAARTAHINVVPVTETLPANENTQVWIDSEVAALERAL